MVPLPWVPLQLVSHPLVVPLPSVSHPLVIGPLVHNMISQLGVGSAYHLVLPSHAISDISFLFCVFIEIQSLGIEFEVDINPCTMAKRAPTDSCVLDLKFRPKHWQACNLPVHNGDRGIIASMRHGD